MATIIEHGLECDGYRIVALISKARVRLHAPTKPKDLAAWVTDAEKRIVAAQVESAAQEQAQAAARKREALAEAASTLVERADATADPRERTRLLDLAQKVKEEYGERTTVSG